MFHVFLVLLLTKAAFGTAPTKLLDGGLLHNLKY